MTTTDERLLAIKVSEQMQDARLQFKSWPVESQIQFLQSLIEELSYYSAEDVLSSDKPEIKKIREEIIKRNSND